MRDMFATFLKKKLFLSFTFVIALVLLVYPKNTFAEYENFKNLFTSDSGVKSVLYTNIASLNDNGISFKDLVFKLTIRFTPIDGRQTVSTEDAEKLWSYVADDFEHGFALRFCIKETSSESCYYSPIPYDTRYSRTRAQKFFTTRDEQDNYTNGGTINYSPTISTTTNIGGGSMTGGTTGASTTTVSSSPLYKETSLTTSEKVTDFIVPYGATMISELWYCAGEEGGQDGTVAPVDNISTRKFLGLCGDTTYFKAGSATHTVTFPKTKQDAIPGVATPTTDDTGTAKAARSSNLPECSFSGGYFGGGTLAGCFAQFLFYFVYRPIAWFTLIIGNLFDFFLGFSINDEAYRIGFIQNGWQVVRDFANIFFIIIMIYTGFSVALGFGKYSLKSVVSSLIISALIINFSLFITRLGIDMSNILARVFYNQMTVETTETAPGGYKPVSVALVSQFNPQKLMSGDILTGEAPQAPKNEEEQSDPDINFNTSTSSLTNNVAKTDSYEYAAFFGIVSLASGLILFFVAKMFFSVAFIFIGRVVSLYMAMIFSPIAFLTMGSVPLIGSISRLNWKDWLSNYQKDLYLPPIFLFFLYIIGYLLGSDGFISALNIKEGTSFFEIVMYVTIPMIIIYVLIGQAKKIADKFASETAKFVTQKIEGAGKFVGGLALGGAVGLGAGALAMGGRGVGALASTVQKSGWGSRNITANLDKKGLGGTMARLTNKGLTGAQNNSFDIRDNKLLSSGLGKLGGQFGMNLKTNNKVLGALNLNQGDSKGGYAAMQKKRDEELKKKVEQIQTSFDDSNEGKEKAQAHYKKIQEKEYEKREKQNEKIRETKEKEKLALENRTSTRTYTADELEKAKAELISRGIATTDNNIKETARVLAIEELKKEIAQAESVSLKDFQKEQEEVYGKVKDNKSLTQALRLRYAQNIANDPEQNKWDTLRATAMSLGGMMAGGPLGFAAAAGAVAYDIDRGIEQRKKAAEKYMKDTRKTFTAERKKAQELDAAINTMNNELTKYINETVQEMTTAGKSPQEIADFKAKYRSAMEKREKNGVTEEYYNHEAVEEYEHLEDALRDRLATIQSEMDELDSKMKASGVSATDRKAYSKEKAKKAAEKDKIKAAKTKIEKEAERKEKEKRDKEEKK